MPNAGLAEAGRDLLRAAVADEATVARFRALTVQIPATPCRVRRRGAQAGRGHGRFWLGRATGRDIVVIAHRFSYTLEINVDGLRPRGAIRNVLRREASIESLEAGLVG